MANRRISITVMRIHVPTEADGSKAEDSNGEKSKAEASKSEESSHETESEQKPTTSRETPKTGLATNSREAKQHRVETSGARKPGEVQTPTHKNVSVGTPDQLPKNVRRSVEPPKPATPSPGNR
jgi:hypothetical protein